MQYAVKGEMQNMRRRDGMRYNIIRANIFQQDTHGWSNVGGGFCCCCLFPLFILILARVLGCMTGRAVEPFKGSGDMLFGLDGDPIGEACGAMCRALSSSMAMFMKSFLVVEWDR